MQRHTISRAMLVAAMPMITACSLGLTDVPDPSTIVSPEIVKTEAGAVGLYSDAVFRFNRTYAGTIDPTLIGNSFSLLSGLGSDEFGGTQLPAYSLRLVGADGLSQNLPGDQPYTDMSATRLIIDQALGALKQYGVNTPSSYVAQLYALRGYISIMFAELYCSGIPLSRAVYDGDIELGHARTTTELYEVAIADLDSSLSVQTDSIRIRRLALVGKARALLGLGEYARAAALVTVDSIPTDYKYEMRFGTLAQNFTAGGRSTDFFAARELTVANRLGGNGLNYMDAGASGPNNDPRVSWYMTSGSVPVPYPAKYNDGTAPVPLADGIEARLIEAEAHLNADDYPEWTAVLNTLRQTGGSPVIPALSTDSTLTANPAFRVDVMFRERAFWLYATGHRFGDMRRLIRQYHRDVATVFPTGVNPSMQTPNNIYSNFPNFAPPKTELDNNPYFSGCFNRDA